MPIFRVYYMRPEFFGDGLMGADWLRKLGKMPDPGKLDATHIFLHEIEAEGLEQVYDAMQAEAWSPNGEVPPIIKTKGLRHISMSVGDIVVDQYAFRAYILDVRGFRELAAELQRSAIERAAFNIVRTYSGTHLHLQYVDKDGRAGRRTSCGSRVASEVTGTIKLGPIFCERCFPADVVGTYRNGTVEP
jgi:hypothetical protein